jgi:uncharacterized protein involved in exopolysaccharide biosynthesis
MELSFVFRACRQNLWVVLLAPLLLGALLLGALQSRQTTYESTAVLLVKPPLSATSGEIGGNDPDRYVETQIGYMESANFIDRILKELKSESRKSVRAALQIDQRPNSDVVEIKALTDNPDRSRRIATVVSDTYLSTFPERNTGRFDKELKKVTEQIDQLNADLQKVEERRLRLPENPVTSNERSAIARVNTPRQHRWPIDPAP